MKKFGLMYLPLFIVSLFLCVSAEAALTGTISGTIIDDTGNPLPGVTVTVQGTGLPGARTDYSNDTGKYRIVLLPPGKYTVKAELSGFKTIEQKDITVKINENSTINITMEVSTFEEVVVVTAEAPVVDTKSSSVGINVDRAFTDRLPGSDSFQDAFAMGGGTTGGGNPFVHGATHTDNLYLFDGVDATDPVTGTFASNLNSDAIEQVEVMTGGFSAEYGKAMGGIVNAVTKTGGNKFEGTLRFKYSTDSLDGPFDPGRPRYTSRDYYEPTLSIGGPVVKDKLWFFISYQRLDLDDTAENYTAYNFDTEEYDSIEVDTSQLWQFYVGKLTWSATPSHNFELSFSSDPMEWYNYGGIYYLPEAQAEYSQGGDRYGLNWTYIHSSNLYFDTKYGYFDSYIYIEPSSGGNGEPPVFDRKSKLHYNWYTSSNENDRSKWSLSTAATYVKENWKGTHEFKTGFEYQVLEERQFFDYSGGVYYQIDYYGTDDEIGYRRYNEVDPVPEKNKGLVYSFYLQDNWEFVPGLTFNLGIRWDQATYKNKLDEEVCTLDGMIAPRLGFAWDMKGDGTSKLYFHVGRYYNTFDLTIVGANPGPTGLSQTWWYDPSDPGADEEGYYLYGTTGGETSPDIIDPGLRPEYSDEIILGYDREIFTNFAAGTRLIYKVTGDIIEDVGFWSDENGNIHLATDVDMNDQAAIDEWYEQVGGDYKYYFTNPDDAYRDYYAIELHASGRTNKFSCEVSYTHSQTMGTSANTQPGSEFESVMQHFTVYFDTPYLSHDIDGRMYYDVPHYLKVYASYYLPLGFVFGTHAWWKSGYTYSRYGTDENGDPAYGDGCRFIGERGSYRYPDVIMVDLSLQKDFSLGKWGVLTTIIDVTNLMNNQVNLSRIEDDGPTFGNEDGWAGPTSVSFQVKYAF